MTEAAVTSRHELKVTHLRPGRYAFGTVGNVAIQIWLCQATEDAAIELKEAAEEVVARYPAGVSCIVWLLSGTDLPTGGARKHFVDIIRTHAGAVGEVGVVMYGAGFWASAVRAMLTGLKLASGGAIDFRVEATLDGLLAWFPEAHTRRTGVRVSGPGIALAITDMLERSRHGA